MNDDRDPTEDIWPDPSEEDSADYTRSPDSDRDDTTVGDSD